MHPIFMNIGVVEINLQMVTGTTTNYFLDGRINRAEILFPGVACFLVAVFLGAAVHSSNASDNQEKLRMSGNIHPCMIHVMCAALFFLNLRSAISTTCFVCLQGGEQRH
jgi:hypothetical protein